LPVDVSVGVALAMPRAYIQLTDRTVNERIAR